MATKLENLEVTKIDFVDNGANPEADILIFKSADQPESEGEAMTGIDKALLNLTNLIRKAFGKDGQENDDENGGMEDDPPAEDDTEADSEDDDNEGVGKSVDASFEEIEKSIRLNGYGMSESMISIMNDSDISEKKEALFKNLNDYCNITTQAIKAWADGKVHSDIAKGLEEINPDHHEVFKSARNWLDEQIEKSNNQKQNEMEENGMDLTKMSKEDRELYDGLVAKYDHPEDDVNKNAEKDGDGAEDIYKGLPKEVMAEIADLRKRADAADDKDLMEVAKGYEMIGKKAEDLFPVLKSLKGTDEKAYQNMIDVLDASKAAVEKSGLFDEIGKSGHNTDSMTAVNKKAEEMMEKNPDMDRFTAIDKVFTANPDLRKEYDV